MQVVAKESSCIGRGVGHHCNKIHKDIKKHQPSSVLHIHSMCTSAQKVYMVLKQGWIDQSSAMYNQFSAGEQTTCGSATSVQCKHTGLP